MDHIYAICDGYEHGCALCRGGLALCAMCGVLEGALTSECSGQRLTSEQEEAVYAGTLDYRQGVWMNASSMHSPAHYRAVQRQVGRDRRNLYG